MFFQRLLTLVILFTAISGPTASLAETRYVSDLLVISLRQEPSRTGSLIGHLRTGDALDVLATTEDGYIMVRTSQGDEGWVAKRYTTDELPKAQLIKKLKHEIANLGEKKKKQLEEIASLNTALNEAQDQLTNLEKQLHEMADVEQQASNKVAAAEAKYTDLLEKSKGVNEVYAERDSLLEQQGSMQQKIAFLEAENQDLVQTGRILWFLAGFGVFLVGWLMGRAGRRVRHSSLSL